MSKKITPETAAYLMVSKPKEEILRDTFTSVEYPDAMQRIEIYRAMEQYADQRVEEFKEKLRADIDAQIKWAQNTAEDEGDHGYVSGLRYLRKLV